MNDPDFQIEIWDPQDFSVIPEILVAASEAHGIPQKSADWFKWKFRDSPWGPALLAYARSSNDGRLAGAVAYGTYQMHYGEQRFLCGLTYEQFVHPDFQRRGLFSRLLAFSEDAARSRGLDILLVLPNESSQQGVSKRGFVEADHVHTWLRVANFPHVVRALPQLGRRAPFEPSKATSVNEALLGNISRLGRPLENGTEAPSMRRVHDLEFLTWRFATLPRFDYRIVEATGIKALVRTGYRAGCRETQVLDLFEEVGASTRRKQLFSAIGRETEADMISLLATSGNPVSKRLLSHRFIRAPNHIRFYVKYLTEAPVMSSRISWSLSGVDIHTW